MKTKFVVLASAAVVALLALVPNLGQASSKSDCCNPPSACCAPGAACCK